MHVQESHSSKQSVLELLLVLLLLQRHVRGSPASATLLADLQEVVPVLLRGYGASLSSTDRTCLAVLQLVDCLVIEADADPQAADFEQDELGSGRVASLFTGPLSKNR